jgi:16S rRNA (adenine1518-N6/adenine1519-N6)-dimethyltransferase
MIYRAKKSLGQNFLKSTKALSDIISAGDISPNEIILEIGPGKGALTEKLLEKAGKVVAIEKDPELILLLREKFAKEIINKKLEIIEHDILDFDFTAEKYKIIANIPYYITGAIIRKFLESNNQPEIMVLLVQKEVAKRIVAQDKKESILSISVKAYGSPVYVDTVKKRYFSPEPKVDSAILLVENISKRLFVENNISEEKFFELVKIGFAHKRKVLSSNLKPLLGGRTPNCLETCEIKEKVRAEDLELKDWICLTKNSTSKD